MGEKQKQARPAVVDISAVVKDGDTSSPVVTDSSIEVADLLCEGPIKGIVSGTYRYYGKMGETGFQKVTTPDEELPFGTFDPENLYSATGLNNTSSTDLGFLRSIYWNQIPVVDKDGYYNFNEINVEFTKGEAQGTIPSLNTEMGGAASAEILDLSIHRNIGERLYGPDIEGGALAPTVNSAGTLKAGTRIDKNAKTYTIFNKECSSLTVNIKINTLQENIRKGPKTFRSNNELNPGGSGAVGYGDTKARSVEYYIYYQPVFDERFNLGTDATKQAGANASTTIEGRATKWYGPVREVVTGKIDQGYVRATKIDLETEVGDYKDEVGFDGWRIRIVRTTPEPLTSFFRAVSFVDSIIEIYGTKLRYPYSAMVYSKFDAENFQRVPARAYDTQLQKIKLPNNYDPMKRTYGKSDAGTTDGGASNNYGTDPDNFWDGNFHIEKYWSDNPAWCFYDLLTNERYGLGEYVSADEIDKWALYEISQYCDELVADGYGGLEPRFSLNHLIVNRQEAYKLINDLASAFRGLAYFANGLIFTVQDSFKKPIYQLNNSNVVDGDFSYSSSAKKARHTVAIVRYIDKRNFFQPAVEYVSDEEGIKKYGIRQVETTAIGCTSRGQARRFGLWILASEKDETDTVSFKMGTEGSHLRPGDIVQLFDNNVSSLKYSGRTNIVSGLAYANTPAADGQSSNMTDVSRQRFSAAYDSVILDSALNFEADKAYTFSLLTPTYHYNSETSDLNSSGIKEIRRSSLQTLYFSGECTRTRTGEYASDLVIGGSGVCTQIFFATGSPFSNTNNSDFTSPTGNRFDFDNYTITGYTNSGVNIDSNSNTSVEYKGGYNNGENLVWSIEPFFEDDEEFPKGNFSNYRIINVKENPDQTHDVSALQYFSGKYDNVESKLAFDNPFLDKNPQTPSLIEVSRRDPTRDNSIIEEYELLRVQFKTVGYAGDKLPNSGIDYLVSIKTGKNYTFTPPEINSAGVQTSNGDDLGYVITPRIPGNPPADPDVGTMGATGYDLYHKPYRQTIVPGSDPSKRNSEENTKIDIDFFITEKANYYVSVFAISPYGVLSEKGQVSILKADEIIGAQSLVNSVNIHALTTSTIPSGADGTPGQKFGNLNYDIPANNPVFSWQVGINTQFDQPGVYVANQDLSYRVTVREPALPQPGSPESINVPNTNIYFEFTGVGSTNFNSPNFSFNTVYNNPNLYTTIVDSLGQSNVSEISPLGADKGKTYYKVDETGFLVQKGLSLPIRKFDVVVEAHDSEGKTSVGLNDNQNRVWYNTIYVKEDNAGLPSLPPENFKKSQNVPLEGYDIVGVDIESIPGIVFPNTSNKPNEYVSPTRAFQLDYPYLAQLDTEPNGYMKLNLDVSEDQATNEVIKTEEEIETIFNNARGLVFYYTTGSEDLENVGTADDPDLQATLLAKQFSINPAAIPDSANARNFGLAKYKDGNTEKTVNAIVMGSTDEEEAQTEAQLMSGVFREYVLLEEGQTVTDLAIKFQKSKIKGVENSQVCMGVFDQLSYLANFNEDNTPKTTTVNYFKHDGTAATYNTPNIFTDPDINFSSIPIITDKSMNGEIGFLDDNAFSPTSFFVLEKSIITTRDRDLSYKAWFDIEIEEFFALDSVSQTGEPIKGGLGQFIPEKAVPDNCPANLHPTTFKFKKPIIKCGRNIKSVDIKYYMKEGQTFLGNTKMGATRAPAHGPRQKDSLDDIYCSSFLTIEFFEPLSRSDYLTDVNLLVQDHPSPWIGPTPEGRLSSPGYYNAGININRDQGWLDKSFPSPYLPIYSPARDVKQINSYEPTRGAEIGKAIIVRRTTPNLIQIRIDHGRAWIPNFSPNFANETDPKGFQGNYLNNIMNTLKIYGGILENSLNDQV